MEIPDFLSSMAYLDPNAYVPGIKDFAYGNKKKGIVSVNEKIQKGKLALRPLTTIKTQKKITIKPE